MLALVRPSVNEVWPLAANQNHRFNRPANDNNITSGLCTRTKYVYADHLDAPRTVTNSSNQSRWEWDDADPFARTLPDQNPSGLGTFNWRRGFPGQFYDAEKSAWHNGFRTYHAAFGRYLQPDPIGLAGSGFSMYGYVDGNPVQFVDPNGTNTIVSGVVIGGSLAGPFGAIAGAGIGLVAGYCIVKALEPCPPCITISGKIIAVGTIGYRPLEMPKDPAKPTHGVIEPHHNIYEANQAPRLSPKPCQCFWRNIGAVSPSSLTANAVPIEPFVQN